MAASGDTVYPTPAQLRAVGTWVQAEGLITGLDYAEGYDANELVTSATLAFSITAASAKEAGHATEDLSIELEVPTVDSTDCNSHFTFAGLNIAHRVDVSIYGPHPALAHTDWVGTGGAGTPDGSGQFAVAASGSPALTLTIPNNFEQIQADAVLQDFPVGGPSVPESYWYHNADHWSASYGAAKPGGGTWGATWEGVYCWRGWGWLKTRLKVPVDSALTLTLAGKTLAPSDNHYADTDSETGENRQTGYSASWTAWSNAAVPHMLVGGVLVPVATVPAGADQAVYWRICLDPDGVTIDPEVVNTLALTGMADGDWQLLAAPTLVLDPTTGVTPHALVKAFEAAAADGDESHSGGSYRKGGYSAVVDYVSYRTLFWGDSANQNVAEDTGGMFDQLKSANTAIDYTSAWTLAQIANLITYSSDAWTVTLDATAYNAALKDADSNELGCWAFDWVPLEQDVDAGEGACAIRCGSWTIAAGVVCGMVPDKVIGGQAHGALLDDTGALYRNAGNALILWCREGAGSWSPSHYVGSDECARWGSLNLEEYVPDSTTVWTWGVSANGEAAPDVTWARAAFREYVRSDHIGVVVVYYDPALTQERGGIVWRVTTEDPAGGNLRVNYTGAQETPSWTFVAAPSEEAVFTRPSIAVQEGALLVAATDTTAGSMRIFRSYDRGTTWSEIT